MIPPPVLAENWHKHPDQPLVVMIDLQNLLIRSRSKDARDWAGPDRDPFLAIVERCLSCVGVHMDPTLRDPRHVCVMYADRSRVEKTWRSQLVQGITKEKRLVEEEPEPVVREVPMVAGNILQMNSLENLCASIGFHLLYCRMVEADDLISLHVKDFDHKARMAIFSNDRGFHRLLQFHRASLRVFDLQGTERLITDAEVFDIVKSLSGDCSKNILSPLTETPVRWPADHPARHLVRQIAEGIKAARIEADGIHFPLDPMYSVALPDGTPVKVDTRRMLQLYYQQVQPAIDLDALHPMVRLLARAQTYRYLPSVLRALIDEEDRQEFEKLERLFQSGGYVLRKRVHLPISIGISEIAPAPSNIHLDGSIPRFGTRSSPPVKRTRISSLNHRTIRA